LARGDDADEQQRIIPPGAAEAEEALVDSGSEDPAAKEAAQLSRGVDSRNLEREAREKEHDRGQAFKDHFELVSIVMLYILFAGFILLSAIWVAHLILPEKAAAGWPPYLHGWLTEGQLDKITGVLAGGIIAGLVADHFKRRMGG
jgi:hypothetical protein